MSQATLQQIIGAIGDRDFAAVTSRAIRGFMRFDLAAMLFHRHGGTPDVLFEEFGMAGFRQGVDTYARVTHRINPILARRPKRGACRARDFRTLPELPDSVRDHIVLAADEELGFRTVGWPPRLEEVGLYFPACDGLVELSLYRERGRSAATAGQIRALGALTAPVAAAFERHRVLESKLSPMSAVTNLVSPREREICELLLIGCSSTAIALRLGISRNTVKDHRKQLFRKLGIGSLAELFALMRYGDRLPRWRDGRSCRLSA